MGLVSRIYISSFYPSVYARTIYIRSDMQFNSSTQLCVISYAYRQLCMSTVFAFNDYELLNDYDCLSRLFERSPRPYLQSPIYLDPISRMK